MTAPTGGHVPLYAGERIVGRAVETEDGWTAQLRDGTPLGSHRTLTEARAAVLARVCRPFPQSTTEERPHG